MARRKLSTQGRVAAAGVSVAVAGVLAGFMAAGDHTAERDPAAVIVVVFVEHHGYVRHSVGLDGDARSGRRGFDDRGGDRNPSGTDFQPQPQTRTGGS